MANQYYPTYVGSDGLVHQSGTPANMPSAAELDKQQQQVAAQERARVAKATAPRNPAPNIQVKRAPGAIGKPFSIGKGK